MAQEDQIRRCSNSNTSSGGDGGIGNNFGRSSKKQRPKKVPQRGLGVAQLEKIRIEEQQKKDAAVAVISPPNTQHKSPYLSLPIPNFHPSNQSCSSSISFPAADVSRPNSIFRPPLSVQNIDIVSTSNTVLLTGCSQGWNPGGAILPGNGSLNNNGLKFWSSCEYNIEKECSELDPGLVFRTNLSLPYESEPIWPNLPSLMQRAQPFLQPSSSMVNLSSRISSTSMLNFQMEPPSNQSYAYYENCSLNLLPAEEKMVGMKRSYPFALDNAPGPLIHTKYPPIVHSINGQVEDAASSSNGSTFNFEPGTPNFREGPSGSTSNFESKSKKSIKQNEVDGDFITLAPPTTTSMCSTLKFKHPPSNLIYYNCELPDLESLANYQASFEDSIIRQGASGLNQYRPYYSFFPRAMVQFDQATTITMANCKGGEVGGHVDLNLKL
ncbi:hypothetical protein REPUB_Repub11eG0048500 [Reevesia pubescens]